MHLGCALLLAALPFGASAAAPEPESCRIVRFSDIGWTDVTATTGIASHLLRNLGYEPVVTVLSVPVTFASLKNKDIDVFLGNWMPAMEADIRPYAADGSVEVLGANLTGAKYTLAVPVYTHEAGLKDFSDIKRFATELKRFNDDVQTKASALQARFAALSSTWQDQEHEKFAEDFIVTMKVLKKFTEVSEKHTPFLLRKAQRIQEYLSQR